MKKQAWWCGAFGLAVAAGLTIAAAPSTENASAGVLRLAAPLDCVEKGGCPVQNYVDHDLGPNARDFMCGTRSLDASDGVDFRITRTEMALGVPVRAAAAGTVMGVRDGESDGAFGVEGRRAVLERECGNGVTLDHGNGWETQYCHLKQGSVRVKPGDAVASGDVLAQVGLSGMSEFAHLHFAVRKNGATIDPFTGGGPREDGCAALTDPMRAAAAPPLAPLWRFPLPYQTAAALDVGFTDRAPEAGKFADALPPHNGQVKSPALVGWVSVAGVQAGDRSTLTLVGPDGALLADNNVAHDKRQALYELFTGIRSTGAFTPGTYRADYQLLRAKTVVAQRSWTLQIGSQKP